MYTDSNTKRAVVICEENAPIVKGFPCGIITTPETRATAAITITNEGTNGDTISLKIGTTVLGSFVKTASESSPTLLAAALVSDVNANTGTNGGYTAANVAGAITVTAPVGSGASANVVVLDVELSGGATITTDVASANFAGGVTQVVDNSVKLAIGTVVKLEADGTIIPVAASTDRPIGHVVSGWKGNDETARVLTPFSAIVKGKADGSVGTNDELSATGFDTTDSLTDYAPSAQGDWVVAIALGDAVNDGDVVVGILRVPYQKQ